MFSTHKRVNRCNCNGESGHDVFSNKKINDRDALESYFFFKYVYVRQDASIMTDDINVT